MIQSRKLNQEAVIRAIKNYNAESKIEIWKVELLRFTKYLAAQMMLRIQDNDCYFVDFLEDIERMEEVRLDD